MPRFAAERGLILIAAEGRRREKMSQVHLPSPGFGDLQDKNKEAGPCGHGGHMGAWERGSVKVCNHYPVQV